MSTAVSIVRDNTANEGLLTKSDLLSGFQGFIHWQTPTGTNNI